MKKLLLSLLTVFILFPAQAQELKHIHIIGNPKKLDSGEMVARRDANGNYCAAIQVISDMVGFSYDSNDGIVSDVDSKPGKDMVFLTASERVLDIFKEGYKPMKIILSDYSINLQAREVWQIEIAGEEKAETLPVVIRYTPEDAQLFVDGVEMEQAKTYNLAVGEHQVKLAKGGYQEKVQQITVNQNNVLFEFELERIKDAALQLTTTPEGATVYIDGIKMGETPVAAFHPPGTYPIRIVKEGYVTIDDVTIEIAAPTTRKDYKLEENMGYLSVNTHENATVYYNGETIANPQKVKLSPQLVKVKVTMPKTDDLEQQVLLKKDDDIVLDMYPKVKTGTIQVAVTPFDAKVELTGDAGEYFTSEGMKVFRDIPFGTYTLKVTADGHKTTEETVILNPNKKVNKTITLKKGSDMDFGIEMVFVKGGTFKMGCTSEQGDWRNDEKPVHEVTLDDFYIGKYEVTQKQWREVMGASTSLSNPSHFSGCDNCPVEQVSWNDVQEFIKKLNQLTGKKYRLPTEAEWEYAARGGTAGTATEYAGSNNIDQVAWINVTSPLKPHPVGQKQPNEIGIYDMSGNAIEWCSDWYDSDYYSSSPSNNPQGPSSGSARVLRGGSCAYFSNFSRVSRRGACNPDSRDGYSNTGFRLARSVEK